MTGTLKVLCFLIFVSKGIIIEGLKLKKVLLISRHNIRTPLVTDLERTTPKLWPKWNADAGFLTPKGALMETYMGEYFAAWLKKEGLLTDECPKEDTVLIYSNTKQRTKASAKAFTNGAFKNCSVAVHHKDLKTNDPVFDPIIHDESQALKEIVARNMQTKIDESNLIDSYTELNKILNIKNSRMCYKESICDLNNAKHSIKLITGDQPALIGPLEIGNAVTDAFLMSYYNGEKIENVAWGEVIDDKQWWSLMKINEKYHDVRFNDSVLARDIAKPLINYMYKAFESETMKLYSLVGHDANICTILSALDFKAYDLKNQFEKTPIGGKLVFQKWLDEINNVDLFKIDYVYQSTSQLRNGTRLSLSDTPQWERLELNKCKANKDGYCLWADFENVLRNLI